jgi:outer membrane protein TolC
MIWCCSLGFLHAQDSIISVSIPEAQEYALEHNKTLQNARKDVLITDQQVKSAWSGVYPKVDGSLNYMTNFNYEFEFGMGGGSNEPPNINDTALDQEILSLLDQMFNTEPSTIVMEDQFNAQLQVSQLIFSGQMWVGIKMAKIARELSELNVNQTELQIKERIINTYYLILVTEEIANNIQKNIDNFEEVMTHTQNMYAAGLAESTDVDQIKVSLSQLKNSKNAMERSISLNYKMLRIQLGADASQPVFLTDSLPAIINDIHQIETKEEQSINDNPTLQLIKTQVSLSEKNVDMNKWSYAPTLAGYYSYTEKFLSTSFDLSPRNAAGLTLSIPIFSGFEKRTKVNMAKIELDKANKEKELVEEHLRMQEKQLQFELKNAYENYKTQKESVDVAKRVYNNIYNKYSQGMISSLDLTQANMNYLQAQNNYISSVMELLSSKTALDKLYNQL